MRVSRRTAIGLGGAAVFAVPWVLAFTVMGFGRHAQKTRGADVVLPLTNDGGADGLPGTHVGDAVAFGPYEWLVLEADASGALLVTMDVVGTHAYDARRASVTWEACDLRAYLNGEFLQGFGDDERARIAPTHVETCEWATGRSAGPATEDEVFLLSVQEAEELMDATSRSASRDWWLRTPGYLQDLACAVGCDGRIDYNGWDVDCAGLGVRPALRARLGGS